MAARLSQATIEAIATSLQKARSSQAALEAVGGKPNVVRVSQAGVEAIQQANALARLSHFVIEAAFQAQLASLSQIVLEAVSIPGAHLADLSQALLELGVLGIPAARGSQAALDILGAPAEVLERLGQELLEVALAANQGYISQELVEVLRQGEPVGRISQDLLEVAGGSPPQVWGSQFLLEVLLPTLGTVLSQEAIEALIASARARVTQVVMEVILVVTAPTNHMRMRVGSLAV